MHKYERFDDQAKQDQFEISPLTLGCKHCQNYKENQ